MLTPDMLSGAGQITLLDISSHYLTSIQENSFKNMTRLRSLTCSQVFINLKKNFFFIIIQ